MKISEIQAKDKKPFRAYFNRVPIWWKYHERTQAIFDYANERYYQLPTNKLAYDDYIRGVVKEGLFDKLDLHYIFSGDGDINFKLLNIINPGTYNGIAFGGLEWSNEGVKGNGVNGYVDTNFNPALLVEGQKYQLNDASRGLVTFYKSTNNNAAVNILDCAKGTYFNRLYHVPVNAQGINNSGNVLSVSRLSITNNFKCICRNNSSDAMTIDKDIYNVDSLPSVALHNSTQLLLKSQGPYGSSGISMYFIGAYLTYEESQIFRTIFNNYLTAIGLEPVA